MEMPDINFASPASVEMIKVSLAMSNTAMIPLSMMPQ